MNNVKFEKLDKLFKFLPKSKIKAGEELEEGTYKFFKSGRNQSKFINVAIFSGESLIIGDGGKANINYYNGKFSTSDHCYVIQKKDVNIDTQYVYYYLKSNIQILEKGFKGIGLKNISKKYISNIRIPLLSLDVQKRISQYLFQTEELIEKRRLSIVLLDDLIKHTFLDIFGNPIIDIKKFGKDKLNNFGNVITGNTPPRSKDIYYNDKFIEWIKTDNLEQDKLYATKAKEYLSKDGASISRKVESGSILVNCIAGSLKSIGNLAMVDRAVSFNQQINAIQPFENTDAYFLYWLLRLSKSYIQNKATKGMKNIISKSTFENIKFIKPDYNLQKNFGNIAKQIENTKATYEHSLNELNELFESVSQKAFSGKLNLKKIELSKDNELKEAIEKTKQEVIQEPKKEKKSFLNKIIDIGLVFGGTALTASTARKIFDNYNKDVEDDIVKSGKDIIDFTNNIIEYEKDVSLKFNDRFLKSFIKVFQEKEVVLNNRLLEELNKIEFEKKLAFSDIKDTLLSLLQRKEVEQFRYKDETLNDFEENIAFRIKE